MFFKSCCKAHILLIIIGIPLCILLVLFTINIINKFTYSCTNIIECSKSNTCEETYCKRTACPDYDCIPIIKSICVYDSIYYYPGDICPGTSLIFSIIFYIMCIISGIIILVSMAYAYINACKIKDSDDNDILDESKYFVNS